MPIDTRHLKSTDFLEPCFGIGNSLSSALVGKNPLKMGGKILLAAGLKRTTPAEAIRLRCIDCCAGSTGEVRKCVSFDCPSWPHRMGKNPFRMGGGNALG